MLLAGGAVCRGRAGSPLGWRGPAPQKLWAILRDAVCLPLAALAFAVAFAAGGQRRGGARRPGVQGPICSWFPLELELGCAVSATSAAAPPSFIAAADPLFGRAAANPLAWLN
jgi:hypothetical protein